MKRELSRPRSRVRRRATFYASSFSRSKCGPFRTNEELTPTSAPDLKYKRPRGAFFRVWRGKHSLPLCPLSSKGKEYLFRQSLPQPEILPPYTTNTGAE
ncbi:hypothetical protein TNIN_329131 [Trichonephila inaurata madagascariensis]|uniref:Uncharacterized protein n=1 Tax=Trichonephila inaurata madagascariensis TaxID=2747483 RepID=A0A8X7BRB6_9ARAC|nr:hypothetical protein TNIN_329131 [Trichonephila inaurata madagascariensis]